MNREIHKIYDYIMKIIIIIYLNEFLMYIGEERKITEVLKTEIPTLNGKTRYLDFLCKLDDGSFCNIEFEFPVAYSDDLKRFFDYNIVVQKTKAKLQNRLLLISPKVELEAMKLKLAAQKAFILKMFIKMMQEYHDLFKVVDELQVGLYLCELLFIGFHLP